jgi:hypothetical protein
MSTYIKIDNKLYKIFPEVAEVIEQLKSEIKEVKLENEALKLLVNWAEECDFGYDNFPEEYERYKNEVKDMGYVEGMLYIAKRVCQRERGDTNG